MAKTKIECLRQHLTNFETRYRRDCVLARQAACPIVINFCNASANGKNFTDATVDISAHGHDGFQLACFQLTGSGKLLSYLGGTERGPEFSRLENFIANKQHEECLLSLYGNKDYNEYNIRVILAANLFGPLAGNYEIGNKGFLNNARRCPKCKMDISENLKNTSLGNGDVWHGYAYILVKRCTVKIGTEVNEEDEGCEPSPKIMRTENFGDDDSDEDSLKVKIQKDTFTSKALSQLLSQTIVNAFAEVNKNQELSRSYIPSFFADSKTIRITMYNCGSDSLILSDSLDMFIHDRGKTILDVTTILSVWYALNFENNIDESDELFPKFKMLYQKSSFKDQTGERFETYSKKCTKPMTEAGENKDIQLFISVETLTTSSTFVLHVIEKSHSLLCHANP